MLTPRQVSAFRAVMQKGAINLAAHHLNLSQPAVSRQIQDLEAGTGLTLFTRTRGGAVRPTADAVALLAEINRHYHGLEQVNRFVDSLKKQMSGTLRVGAMPALYLSFLPVFVGSFVSSRVGVDVPIMATSSPIIMEWLEQGQIDIGLVDYPFDLPNFERIPLAPVQAVAAVPADHPLAEKPELSPEDFADEPFISMPKNTQFRIEVDRFFREKQIRRTLIYDADMSMVACSMAAENRAITIVDPISASLFWEEGVRFRTLKPQITASFAVVYLKSSANNALLREFTAELQTKYAQFVESVPGLILRRARILREG